VFSVVLDSHSGCVIGQEGESSVELGNENIGQSDERVVGQRSQAYVSFVEGTAMTIYRLHIFRVGQHDEIRLYSNDRTVLFEELVVTIGRPSECRIYDARDV